MDTTDAVAALSALAQETRLAIFRLLVEAGTEGHAVGRVGEALGLPSATLSFHLKELKHAGLVTVRRDGRSLVYSANFAEMNALLEFLTRNCCGGDPQACGLPAGEAERRTLS
ncbi:ArsR/SmtB family transcription factor [Acuticoccus kandeliae]|uniref:ArsR/SmtB family transcription factor n=1 Tax=Acuticoccus kandeliae TaxID=2073160 RepID=UPI000D3EA1F9|nr:metalloregulator ArsR/SmtB family transcription factor [Acuticoccus kandeliae]